jgi:hypothetical protein
MLVLLVIAALPLSGCVALGLGVASMGASAFSAGTGAAVHAGTEYAKNGSVYRTFSLPLNELRIVLGDTLARMELAVVEDEAVDGERRISAKANDREVNIRLEPVTRTVTRMKLAVSEGSFFSKDRATASEIVAQTERAVERYEAAAVAVNTPPAAKPVRGTAASSPARAARR